MSVMGMKPLFTNREEYLGWMVLWKHLYRRISTKIRRLKIEVKEDQRAGIDTREKQRSLVFEQRVAWKMMTVREEAIVRRERLFAIRDDLTAQNELFPLVIEDARAVDFHFNKGHLEIPFLPMWTVRVKGKSYYVEEVEADCPWKTHERVNGSTKGVLRFPRCRIEFGNDNIARITSHG